MEMVYVVAWGVLAVISAVTAGKKGYSPGVWLVLGFLFGVFAVIVVALLPDKSGRKED
jgi:hypothetical protein